jgi:hypothetical protein
MTDEVHPLVTLLVARAKSHPGEFEDNLEATRSGDRWWPAISTVSRHGTDADKALMASTVGRIAMDKTHEWALDELLNGEERRVAERRRHEEDKKRYAAQQSQQSQLYAQAAHNSYQNALSNISGANQSLATNNSITLGDETLTAGMLSQIKKALGVKK